AQYTTYDGKTVAPILAPAGQRSAWQVLGFLRPVPGEGFFYLESSLERVRNEAGSTTRARLGASLQSSEIRLLPYLRLERVAPPAGAGSASTHGFVGVSAFVLPRPHWGPVFDNLLLR